jgi:putative ABC transport system permease protein
MLKHFLITTFRQFLNDKFYMVIKIIGLAIGIAVSLLIMLYVMNELSFDDFNQRKAKIYNMVVEEHRGNIVENSAVATAGIGPSLLEEFPEISSMTRLSIPGEGYFLVGDQSKTIQNIVFADSSVFDIFTFPMIQGNSRLALIEPFTIVLTKSTAKQLFDNENPIGKIIKLNGSNSFRVTGLVEDPPKNSTIQFGALLSFSSLYKMDGYFLDWDGGWAYYTFVTLADNINWSNFNGKLPGFLEKHINYKYRNFGIELYLHFDPLKKVHLYSSAAGSFETGGDPKNLFIFGAVALFVLLIACINFMNMSTARFAGRTKEVGVRKVLGANRNILILQFLGESLSVSFVAVFIAVLLVELFLPDFSDMIGSRLGLFNSSFLKLVAILIMMGIIVGMLAGSYPAFFMSSFNPIKVIKGNLLSANKGKGFRNILVIFQFMMSTILIIATLTVFRQLNYINNKPLGYQKENVIVLDLKGEASKSGFELLKNELKTLPFVAAAGASSDIPVYGFTLNGYTPEGMDKPLMFHVIDVDNDFLAALGIKILSGRNFSVESATDENSFLINQRLAENLGWTDPLGKTIYRDGGHKIIGVVGDFHFAPLHQQIEPLVITRKPYAGYNNLAIRINTNDYPKVISEIEKTWAKLFPSEPFIYNFLDQSIKESYGEEQRFGKLFSYFAALAILISCLGLFGLASYLTQQRRKEIGIRKTFGARTNTIILWLAKDFTKLVVIGNLIGWPLSWFLMQRWLDNFAYKAPLSWWIFIVTLAISLIIAVFTVAWQSFKAAHENPVESLKYE